MLRCYNEYNTSIMKEPNPSKRNLIPLVMEMCVENNFDCSKPHNIQINVLNIPAKWFLAFQLVLIEDKMCPESWMCIEKLIISSKSDHNWSIICCMIIECQTISLIINTKCGHHFSCNKITQCHRPTIQ